MFVQASSSTGPPSMPPPCGPSAVAGKKNGKKATRSLSFKLSVIAFDACTEIDRDKATINAFKDTQKLWKGQVNRWRKKAMEQGWKDFPGHALERMKEFDNVCNSELQTKDVCNSCTYLV